ncbi:hypothetical protein [Clostridium sp.]|uniref:hypothetical protein n=1 Tax=Clostridium sp. TaxID=1506 RepID=UPI002A8B9FA8|nr:hypothetical protein [Clostridium sp.]
MLNQIMVAESVRRRGFVQLRIKRILNAPKMIFPQKEFEIITELENKKLRQRKEGYFL